MTEQSIYFNGQWYEDSAKGLPFINESMFFGESPFTSLSSVDGKLVHWSFHEKRLSKSIEFLYESDPKGLVEKIKYAVNQSVFPDGHGYYRVTLFRGLGGVDFYIFRRKLDFNLHELSPLKLTRSKCHKTETLIPNFLKLGSYALSHLEIKEAQSAGFDDIVYTDPNEKLLEASTSNIFFVKGEQVFTPYLNSMILDGAMRSSVIKVLELHDVKVEQGQYSCKDLLIADEVFLTNSIKGITPVSQFEQTTYGCSTLTDKLKNWWREDFKRQNHE
jgi:branched-subunit amino acid aminotransferase/4-amino-4-deoxychorismate lyase